MYGVPGDLDLSRFVGARLDEIGLGEFIVQFRFQAADTPGQQGSLLVGVEGKWELRDDTGVVIDQSQPNADREAYRVHRLLGQTVVATAVDAPESFALHFDGSEQLHVFDDSEHYESFSIHPGDIFV